MLKKLVMALSLATLLASPAFAQSYTQNYGTGNVVNMPLAEQTNGAQGIGEGDYSPAPSGSSAYAFAPDQVRTPRHKSARTMH